MGSSFSQRPLASDTAHQILCILRALSTKSLDQSTPNPTRPVPFVHNMQVPSRLRPAHWNPCCSRQRKFIVNNGQLVAARGLWRSGLEWGLPYRRWC